MTTQELDRFRARAATPHKSQYLFTAGNEPLIVDLVLPGAKPGWHWIVEQLTFMTSAAVQAPSTTAGFPPLSGLYLCPPDTPGETLAQAAAGWVPDARPFLIPMGLPGGDFASINGAAPFPMVFCSAPGFKITVPYGWFLRGILTCLQGTAAPGPGAGSFGQLRALAVFEADDRCNQG